MSKVNKLDFTWRCLEVGPLENVEILKNIFTWGDTWLVMVWGMCWPPAFVMMGTDAPNVNILIC